MISQQVIKTILLGEIQKKANETFFKNQPRPPLKGFTYERCWIDEAQDLPETTNTGVKVDDDLQMNAPLVAPRRGE